MLMKDELEEREMGNNYRQERRWDTLNTKKTHKHKYMQKVKCTTKMREGGIYQIQRKTQKHTIYHFLCKPTKKANIYSTSKLAIVESKF